MAACMAPNNATPNRPVTAPAIRNAVSLPDGRGVLIIVLPQLDRRSEAPVWCYVAEFLTLSVICPAHWIESLVPFQWEGQGFPYLSRKPIRFH